MILFLLQKKIAFNLYYSLKIDKKGKHYKHILLFFKLKGKISLRLGQSLPQELEVSKGSKALLSLLNFIFNIKMEFLDF